MKINRLLTTFFIGDPLSIIVYLNEDKLPSLKKRGRGRFAFAFSSIPFSRRED